MTSEERIAVARQMAENLKEKLEKIKNLPPGKCHRIKGKKY